MSKKVHLTTEFQSAEFLRAALTTMGARFAEHAAVPGGYWSAQVDFAIHGANFNRHRGIGYAFNPKTKVFDLVIDDMDIHRRTGPIPPIAEFQARLANHYLLAQTETMLRTAGIAFTTSLSPDGAIEIMTGPALLVR